MSRGFAGAIRPAGEADWPAILAIYNWAIEHTTATFDLEPTTIERRRPWFAQFGAAFPLLVADLDGAVVGYAYYLPYRAKPAYAKTVELTVYVDADSRAAGTGSALYEALIDHARDRGTHALIAVIAGDNPASEALHQRFGFEPIGRLKEVGFKFGRYVDTRYWQRLL